MTIIQLAGLAVITILTAVFLKKYQAELSLYLCVGMCLLLLVYVVQAIGKVMEFVTSIAGSMNVSYIGVLIKLLGIAYICEFASGLCKDAGYQSVAGQIEMAGRVAMLVLALPVIKAILVTMNGWI